MYKRIIAVVKKILRRLCKPKTIGFIVVVLIGAVGIILWYRNNQSPAQGVINNGIAPSEQSSEQMK